MNNIKYNKKLVNNVILGSSLFGSSASITTTVQATPQLHAVGQKVHEYSSSATNNLSGRLYRRNLSMEECIRFVKDRRADPNEQSQWYKSDSQQRKSLTLLEEAILSRYPEALEIFIVHGADVCKVSDKIKNEFGREVTLLHLALLTPEEMKELDEARSVDRPDRQERPNPLIEALEEAKLEQEAVPPSGPYIPKAVLESLLKELSAKQELKSKLNAKDKNGKTVLDWAIERRCIALEKLQKSESDLKVIAEYKDVIEILLFKDIPYSKENETIYSKITAWEVNVPANLRRHLSPALRQELKQWRQRLEK
jgi:hypothetical protein